MRRWQALGLATVGVWAPVALAAAPGSAANDEFKQEVEQAIEAHADEYAGLAHEIWEFAEVGYQEERSAASLKQRLRSAGFSIEEGVAGIPTAFVASYGSGSPTIAILAEFDALPGLSQAAGPTRQPLLANGPGHGCGHHLFGTASTAAAITIRQWLDENGITGTLRLYGTPAEEGGSGKVYMTRDGLFDDVDVVLHWHPSDRNRANLRTSLANKSAKFRFHGEATHAAGAPERGRSALDAVEAMNFLVNLMREHVPQETRIHYVITHGGDAPNVVPDFAEVYYYVRHPEVEALAEIWDRVITTAEAAGLGTGTRLDYEIIHGNQSLLPNETLARLIDANLRLVGGPKYNDEETRFAVELRQTLRDPALELGSQSEVQPLELRSSRGSTDVGDVSWTAPTGGFNAATWVPGTSSHSWQAVAAGGMSIGTKGMIVAVKTLAYTAIDLYTDTGLIAEARKEFEQRRGPDFEYVPLLGDRDPPLDYRR